jgi:D-alanine-D-alanine ligase
MKTLGLKPVSELTDERAAWCWQTPAGLNDGTLLVVHVDVPRQDEVASQVFRREPEWLFGEGIGSSRAPIVSMLFALQALKRWKLLRGLPLGVLVYADEGRDCQYSQNLIRQAVGRAKNVLVLRPGNVGGAIVTSRRGQRRYRLSFQGEPLRLGRKTRKTDVLTFAFGKLQECTKLTSHDDRVAVASIDLRTVHMPLRLPHEVVATLLVSFPESKSGDDLEARIREILQGNEVKWKLDLVSDRPPMKDRRGNAKLVKSLMDIAKDREIPLKRESSLWPSVAGLVPTSGSVVCGIGPVARELYTPEEAVDRISLMQRTLLLAELLQQQTN